MSLYIFDEDDVFFMSPGVPMQAPATLRLRIKVQCGMAVKVKALVYPDGSVASQAEMEYLGVCASYDVFGCEITIDRAGLYWYCFRIYAIHGGIVAVPEHEGGSYQFTVFSPEMKTPDWIYGGIIYHIFVDRFNRGGELFLKPGTVFRPEWGDCPHFLPDENGIVRNNDFFGGDLLGIIEKLPYLEGLGVTCLYLSPVFDAASNHKYDTGDYMKIDPAFGDDETMEMLCSKARGHGMRVILDGVFNHVGSDSRYFNKYGAYDSLGAYQSKDSPYYEWFNFHEDGTYDSWWGIDLLPSVNEGSKSYIDFVCGDAGVIAHWSGKGVSGWRLDVVDELPDAFLDPLCEAMKRENCDAFVVGEVWEDASNKIAYSVRRRYFQGGQLDSVMNYPLKDAIIACVKENNVQQLARTMATLRRNYPKHVLDGLMNILGTHDTMRLLTALGGEDFPEGRPAMSKFRLSDEQLHRGKKLIKLASALQFTLPGAPCIYYGDEAGMEGGADPFNRRCYPWGSEDMDLVSWYTMLGRLRRTHECFKDGEYTLVEARNGLFAFTRGEGNGRVLVAVNMTDDDKAIRADGFNFDLLNNVSTQSLTVKAGQPAMFSIV